jgi:hypothetical protein
MKSQVPATFNMGNLFYNLKGSDQRLLSIVKFIKSKNILDYRITAKEDINKCGSFCDISLDLVYLLFDSINFHQLFDLEKESDILDAKIAVYNDLVSHYKFDLIQEYQDSKVNSREDYNFKISVFLKPLIFRCIKLHVASSPYNTEQEGVYSFWEMVDHYIFVNKTSHHLKSLKTFQANK